MGPSPAHAARVRRFRFLSYSSPSRGSGGSDSAFFPQFPSTLVADWRARAHRS
jgi:hypothetical protein